MGSLLFDQELLTTDYLFFFQGIVGSLNGCIYLSDQNYLSLTECYLNFLYLMQSLKSFRRYFRKLQSWRTLFYLTYCLSPFSQITLTPFYIQLTFSMTLFWPSRSNSGLDPASDRFIFLPVFPMDVVVFSIFQAYIFFLSIFLVISFLSMLLLNK